MPTIAEARGCALWARMNAEGSRKRPATSNGDSDRNYYLAEAISFDVQAAERDAELAAALLAAADDADAVMATLLANIRNLKGVV